MARYRPEVLEELAAHGVAPGDATPPRLVKDYLNDLYRYEIRKLRDRLVAGEIAKKDYAATVLELRKKYPLLGVPLRLWTY